MQNLFTFQNLPLLIVIVFVIISWLSFFSVILAG